MRRSLLTPGRLLAIVVVLLLISSLLPTSVAESITAPPRALLTAVVSPVSRWLHVLSVNVRGTEPVETAWGENAMSREDLEAQYSWALAANQRLREENAGLTAQVVQLRQIRDRSGLAGVSLVGARVTGYAGSRENPLLVIDRGRNSGVETGMAVAAMGLNLVGEVVAAGPVTSDIRLITTEPTRLQVWIRPPTAEEVPRGFETMVERAAEGAYFVVEVPTNTVVEEGDLAHLSDSRWPSEAQGSVVGQVTEVTASPDDPYQFKRVVVTPIAPLSRLSEVTVLVPTE